MSRKIRQQICGNCQYTFNLDENFCPKCGQENHIPNQPIKHYLSELTETLLHLDSKFFITIFTLIRFPGKITYEYNQNKRARYMPPIRLYVFVSLVFFLILQIPKFYSEPLTPTNGFRTIGDPISEIDSIGGHILSDSLEMPAPDSVYDLSIGKLKFNMRNADLKSLKSASATQLDSAIIAHNGTPSYFTRTLLRQLIKSVNSNEDFDERIKEKIIKFSSGSLFLLMPLFGFLLFGLYMKRKKYYYEYLIFSVHYHSVIFVNIGLLLLLNKFVVISGIFYFLSALGLIAYLAKALKYNFGQSWKRTIFKSVLLCFVYGIFILITFVFVAILGWWFV